VRDILSEKRPSSVSKRLLVPAVFAAVLGLLAAGCRGDPAESATTSVAAAPTCPKAWRAGWQKLANDVKAPVYCPSWLPEPLHGKIGPLGSAKYVGKDRSYLVAFFWLETTPTGGEEVHVNLRGYPGRTKTPVCEDTVVVKKKILHPKIPCFDDARGQKRFGSKKVTVYTANQGADQWHVLYAWRHRGTLYALSEHIAPPYTYKQVRANLDRMMRGLVLVQPSAT
jgi:hypothetical protein